MTILFYEGKYAFSHILSGAFSPFAVSSTVLALLQRCLARLFNKNAAKFKRRAATQFKGAKSVQISLDLVQQAMLQRIHPNLTLRIRNHLRNSLNFWTSNQNTSLTFYSLSFRHIPLSNPESLLWPTVTENSHFSQVVQSTITQIKWTTDPTLQNLYPEESPKFHW